ncbi:hypothetical protein HXX76_011568 [Chlamydomonas incerta]|uniref:Uncharacterized protein n=1 Tax=Chlamydomonas incerta TaxID=51695 RepID=A0A835SRN0_CHLIN|nr:hypothetical protein HXX76_011568 [Chlamydomonas incerta]|eukprot:KAG2428448.1 hypothetical protein HXX76_011568 [Chlamydomonas incerta]
MVDWLEKLNSLGLTADENGKARHLLLRMLPEERQVYLADPSDAAAVAVRALLAGVAAGPSSRGTTDAGLLEALFPSTLYCITFTLYDGADLAMRLVSHAKANGFRGEVTHVSTSRSDFTLLLKTEDEASKQTLQRFTSWLATEVPVHAPAVETNAAFTKAKAAAAARVEVTSDLSNPLTRDRKLLDMYSQGQLTIYAAMEVRLALENVAKAVEQRERLSKSSLGRSRASSSHE